LTERIREIAATRVRYAYRRIHVLLRRDGWRVNAKRVYRLYREMGLQLRNKTPKRRVKAKLREDRRPAMRSNETWAMRRLTPQNTNHAVSVKFLRPTTRVGHARSTHTRCTMSASHGQDRK
jgi:transposase InsO family protein